MPRFLRVAPEKATVHDCVAHRCERHDNIHVLEHTCTPDGDGLAECAYCVADEVVKTLVAETIFPVVAAFEKAEGALALLGAERNPSTSALFALLKALTQKAGENDFEVHAQRVINDTLVSQGPKDPQ